MRAHLNQLEAELTHPTRVTQATTIAQNFFISSLKDNPALRSDTTSSSFQVSLIDILHNPKKLIQDILAQFMDVKFDGTYFIFPRLRDMLRRNLFMVSGLDPSAEYPKPPRFTMPGDYKGPSNELIDAYLTDTPFKDFVLSSIPFTIRESTRFEHCVIVAGTGWGKTQLLQNLALSDIKKDDPLLLLSLIPRGRNVSKKVRLFLVDM
jgi:hypothetical protein